MVILTQGRNEIRITGTDLLGRTSEQSISVLADFTGPLIFLEKVTDGQIIHRQRVDIRASLADVSGIKSVRINNNVYDYNSRQTASLSHPVVLEPGENTTIISAVDAAGNITKAKISLSYVPARVDSIDEVIFACKTAPFLTAGAASVSAGSRSAGYPSFDLNGLKDGQTVYTEAFFLEGTAYAPAGIQDIIINGTSFLKQPEGGALTSFMQSMIRKKARSVLFSKTVHLHPGENTLVIGVRDTEGHILQRSITVTRKVPAVRRIGSRLTVALCPLKEHAGPGESCAEYIQAHLQGAFVRQRRFNVLERAELQRILKEQALSSEAVFDTRAAVRLGRMLAAETILLGDVFADDGSVEIIARMVDTESSMILAEKDVYWRRDSTVTMREVVAGLALKFKRHFPLVEGTVLKVDSGMVTVDLGKEEKVFEGMRLLAFRYGEHIAHPVTGKRLGCETERLCQLKIQQVSPRFSKAEVIHEKTKSPIRKKDRVIAK